MKIIKVRFANLYSVVSEPQQELKFKKQRGAQKTNQRLVPKIVLKLGRKIQKPKRTNAGSSIFSTLKERANALAMFRSQVIKASYYSLGSAPLAVPTFRFDYDSFQNFG